jgi:hypothetical protein
VTGSDTFISALGSNQTFASSHFPRVNEKNAGLDGPAFQVFAGDLRFFEALDLT